MCYGGKLPVLLQIKGPMDKLVEIYKIHEMSTIREY